MGGGGGNLIYRQGFPKINIGGNYVKKDNLRIMEGLDLK